MFNKGVLKRAIPFVTALSLGLFVASFFVTIAVPRFSFNRDRNKHRQYHQRMERENYRLRMENSRLKSRLESIESRAETGDVFDLGEMNLDVPPPPPMVPLERNQQRLVRIK